MHYILLYKYSRNHSPVKLEDNLEKIPFQKKCLKNISKGTLKHAAADPVLSTQLNHSTVTHILHSRIIKTKKKCNNCSNSLKNRA